MDMKCIYLILIVIAIVGLSRSEDDGVDDVDPAVIDEVRKLNIKS